MVRAGLSHSPESRLTITQDLQEHINGLYWPHDAVDYDMSDSMDFASTREVFPEMSIETTASLLDDVFVDPSGIQTKHVQYNETNMPASKPRKSKARTLRDSDWEPHKDLIVELYSRQNMDAQSVQWVVFKEKRFFAEYD